MLTASGSFSQQNPNAKYQTFKFTFLDTSITTGDKFIIQGSDSLRIGNLIFASGEDYKIDYRKGIISFTKGLFPKYSLDTTRIYDLQVIYDIFPYNLKDVYSNFDVSVEKDTLSGDTIQVAVQKRDILDNLFETSDLEKSGSIFRGFTVGSNRDLSLNSGFRLQLNGRLSKDIEITAALTDENTPIQPEGNTLKLQELDKVFIELKSTNLSATIGDIDVNFRKSEFLNFTRKIQGAKGYGNFGTTNFMLTGAVSRGKYSSNKFNGIDGVQGPYRLNGANNEINILVLSGTEKVYVDGIILTRGEQADYVIDYGLGQITFTTKKLITNASRITVDFEYSDRKYSRTFLGFNNNYGLLKRNLNISLSYISETDNENKTIDFTLSDTDKIILKNAGNDPLKASKSGVSVAGRDSLTNRGIGNYKAVDTVINFVNYRYYRFAPGDSNAVYNVNFSYVGQGKGDYNSLSTYQYNFIGINQGSYAPIVFIPVPSSYQMAVVTLDFTGGKDKSFTFKLESAYSSLNKNKFSDINKDNGGIAFLGEIGYSKNNFKAFGINFTDFSAKYKQRIINRLFSPIDRINNVEFYRNFDASDSSNVTEDFKEGLLSISPGKTIKMRGYFGQLRRGDFFNSYRTAAAVEFNNPSASLDTLSLPKMRYLFENIISDNSPLGISGNWSKHNAFLGYRNFFGFKKMNEPFIEFVMNFNAENRKSRQRGVTGDSLKSDSFSFEEFIPKLSLNNLYDFNLFAEYNYRKDDNASNGAFVNFSNLSTQRYGLNYNGVSWIFSSIDLSIQNRLYSDYGKNLGNADNKTILVNSLMRLSPLRSAVQTDLLYTVSSERTAKIQRVFVLVPRGQGNYIYIGDPNHIDLQNENNFQLVNYDGNYIRLNLPTDQYFPTVDLKTSARIYIKPSRYHELSGNSVLANVINNFSAETILKIDEKSKDPNTDNIYFLHFNTFLNDSNTIAGNQWIQQDLNFFENNPEYSLRLRYIQQKGMSQYSSGNERQYSALRSVKMRLGLTTDLTGQFEYINKSDRNSAPVNSVRNRNILSNSFNSDITYRPIQNIESGLQLNFAKSVDYFPLTPIAANINQQILKFIYSFASVGRLRVELERDEVLLNADISIFPYELTNGRTSGKSYFLRAALDYNVTRNIQASVNYDGRQEGKNKVIHTGRAQVTAFF